MTLTVVRACDTEAVPSRRTAVIIVAVASLALVIGIVVFWSRDTNGSTSAFCASVRSGENPLDTFDRYDPSNADTAQLKRGVDRLRQLERAAPGDLKSDLQVLVDVGQQVTDALDAAAQHKTVPDLSAQFGRAATASARVTAFAASQCGITLESGASDSPHASSG